VCRVLVLSLVGGLVLNAAAYSQSLADVAHEEEQRRQTIVEPGRVYTNRDLPEPSEAPPARDPSVATVAPADAKEDGKEAQTNAKSAGGTNKPKNVPVAPRVKRDERHWRERTQQFRTRLDKLRADVAAIQSRVESLRASAQTPAIISDTRQAEQDLRKFQSELHFIELDWAQFEERARDADVPSAWLQ
jgi:hypothetical protein